MVPHTHLKTPHGEMGYTMTEVRKRFLIPNLRQFPKRIIHKRYVCKRFQAVVCPASAVGDLPLDRTSDSRQFQVIHIDFETLIYIKKGKQEGKAYILMYSCSLTRAVYVDLMRDQSLEKFLTNLQRFIGHRGRPENFSTFAAALKWLTGGNDPWLTGKTLH